MRELRVSGLGSVDWSETAPPRLESAAAAIVQPVAVATCDFDHLLVSGAMRVPAPFAIGHECVAKVIAVGEHVRSVALGELVVVPFQIACGSCGTCLRGRSSSCERVPWLSCYGLGQLGGAWGGVVADQLLVPYADAMLVPLPAGVSANQAAAVSCNISDAYRCVAPPGANLSGARVFIASGAFRNIALYATSIAKSLGAHVDFYDANPHVRARAEALGARSCETPSDVEQAAYAISVDASMDRSLLTLALNATAPAGICTASTMYMGEATPLPLLDMFKRGLTFRTGQPDVRTDMVPVLELLAQGTLDLSAITDAVVDWEDAPAAFRSGAGKYICVL
jgi:threonine dehydrogenase-like Zn-dependent dehydrogenase